jgi:hypothetical protein
MFAELNWYVQFLETSGRNLLKYKNFYFDFSVSAPTNLD